MKNSSVGAAKVVLNRDHHAVFLTLNNPAKLNAIDGEMTYALNDALDEIAAEDPNLPLVLQGAGSTFMAGADLDWFSELLENERFEDLAASLTVAQGVILKLAKMRRIVIGAVRGAAIGYGFGLACAADIVIASDTASFKLGQPSLGLAVDGGLSYTLPQLIGQRLATDIVLTDRAISAERAHQCGLVTKVVKDGEWQDAVASAVRDFCRVPAATQQRNKTLLREGSCASLSEHLRLEQDEFLAAVREDTFRGRLRAFLDHSKK